MYGVGAGGVNLSGKGGMGICVPVSGVVVFDGVLFL